MTLIALRTALIFLLLSLTSCSALSPPTSRRILAAKYVTRGLLSCELKSYAWREVAAVRDGHSVSRRNTGHQRFFAYVVARAGRRGIPRLLPPVLCDYCAAIPAAAGAGGIYRYKEDSVCCPDLPPLFPLASPPVCCLAEHPLLSSSGVGGNHRPLPLARRSVRPPLRRPSALPLPPLLPRHLPPLPLAAVTARRPRWLGTQA